MYNDVNDLLDKCMNVINEKVKNLKTLNIVVVGKSGVGKSTLINSVFREDLAETGTGKPVTQHTTLITKKGIPLGIYDTKGFELGKQAQQEVQSELIYTIREGIHDTDKAIHCIWYCVSVPSNRFEPEEVEWIRNFAKETQSYKIPIIIVLTQSFSKNSAQELKKIIENENLDVIKVIPVLAQDYVIDDNITIQAYGTDTLIEVMQEKLPDELIDTLMNVQQANLKLKQKKAQAAVASAAALAMTAGVTPIPFSDAALLIPIEVGMMASITVVFGFEISKSILTSMVSTVIGTSGATFAGKAFVSNLFKLIPGLGTLAGGVISGATAAMLTTGLGEAYIGVMTAMFKGEINAKELGTEEGKKKFGEIFRKELTAKRRKV